MKADMYDLSREAVANLVNSSFEAYGTYSYAAGFLQSELSSCIAQLKEKEAMVVIERLNAASARWRKADGQQQKK